MKLLITFVAFALVTIFVQNPVSACTVSCNTYSTTQVCGKYGTTCRRFSNTCQRKLYNCVNGITYAKVALSKCSSISVGSSGTCSSTSTPTVTVAYLGGSNGYGSYGYGSYGSYGSVTPIVISG